MPFVVEKGRAETLVVYPPRGFLAKPTAADIRAGTPAVSLPAEGSETSITANIDPVSTTLSGAASRGDSSVTLASVANVTVGRRFLITASSGVKQTPTVIGVVGSDVHFSEPLRDDVNSGASFVGLATTHTLTTGETATVGDGRVIVRLTIAGIVRRIDDVLRVVERIFPVTLTPDHLVTTRPEAARLHDAGDQTMEELITSGWDLLRFELNARQILEERIITPSAMEMAHIEACMLRLYESSSQPLDRIAKQEERFRTTLDKTLLSRTTWYEDAVSSGVPGRGDLTSSVTQWVSR